MEEEEKGKACNLTLEKVLYQGSLMHNSNKLVLGNLAEDHLLWKIDNPLNSTERHAAILTYAAAQEQKNPKVLDQSLVLGQKNLGYYDGHNSIVHCHLCAIPDSLCEIGCLSSHAGIWNHH